MEEVAHFLFTLGDRLEGFEAANSSAPPMSTSMPPKTDGDEGSLVSLSDTGALYSAIYQELLTPDGGPLISNSTPVVIDAQLRLDASDALDPRWWALQLILDMLPTLPSSVAQHVTRIAARVHGGSEAKAEVDREQMCIQRLTSHLPELVAHTWAETYGSDEAEAGAERLTRNIKASMSDALQQNAWLTPTTRQTALEKLRAMQDNVGFANHTEWLADYDTLDISSDAPFVENWLMLRRFHDSRRLLQRGQLLDPDRKVLNNLFEQWDTINAFYSPNDNSINIFPVTLQPNWYSVEWADLLNAARLGMVLGHEMTHGFDKDGHEYDAEGKHAPWFTNDDDIAFGERSQCFQDHFEQPWLKKEPLFNVSSALGRNCC